MYHIEHSLVRCRLLASAFILSILVCSLHGQTAVGPDALFNSADLSRLGVSSAVERKFVNEAFLEAMKEGGTNDALVVANFHLELSKKLDAMRTGWVANEMQSGTMSTDGRHISDLMGDTHVESLFVNPSQTANRNSLALIREFITGDSSVRIIPGISTTNAFPTCVAVGDKSIYFASGVLVASNLVVTAGHIASLNPTRVFFGSNIDSPGLTVFGKTVPPGYFGFTGTMISNHVVLTNDFGAIILNDDVSIVPPCPLADAQQINSTIGFRIAGFGVTNMNPPFRTFGSKRDVSVPITCYNCDSGAHALYSCNVSNEIVAVDRERVNDSCFGDSGGPAYLWDQNAWYLAAVNSRVVKPSNVFQAPDGCGNGSVYSRIDGFYERLTNLPNIHWPKK
jgi:hypothetical protein